MRLRAILRQLIIVVFYASLGYSPQAADPALHLKIDRSKTQTLPKSLYGFNTNMMSGDYGYLDSNFVALTKDLQPQLLRFPGGTIGNFYHWKLAGFVQSEMSSTSNEQLNRRNRGNFVRLRKRRNGRLAFDDFMQMCNALKITPIVVVNLWTGSPEESAGWVQYAKNKGYEIAYWELGNEYYLPWYADKYPSAETYIAQAKKHAQAMKAVDPNIKVSVCASPVAFHKNGFEKNVDQRKWDSALAAADQFYDAYTVHVYAYRTARQKKIEEYRGYLFGWIHCDFDDAVDYYKKLFPSKEMWITEWNIANPANRVANTQLHAMYTGDFFLKMLTRPRITHANFHVIAGPGKGFPAFSPITPPSPRTNWKYGGEPEADYGKTIRRAAYYPLQLIGEAFAQSDSKFALSIQNPPILDGQLEYEGKQIPGIQAQAVGNAAHLFVLISNRTADDLSPNLTIDDKKFKGTLKYRYVAHERLNASNGGNAEMEGAGKIEVAIREWSGACTNLLISKNSFGILELSLK